MKDHLSQHGGNTVPNAAWDAVDVLCCEGTLLAHVQLLMHQGCARPVLQSCFSSMPLACTSAWNYACPDAGLHISLCRTSWGSNWSISPACWGPSEWQHNHLVYQQFPLVFHPLRICWGCTLFLCPKVKINNMYCFFVIRWASKFVIDHYEVCQAWYLLCTHILFTANQLVLNASGNGFWIHSCLLWIIFLFLMCLETVSGIICSIIFPGTEVRLTAL